MLKTLTQIGRWKGNQYFSSFLTQVNPKLWKPIVQNTALQIIKASGTYSYRWALKGKKAGEVQSLKEYTVTQVFFAILLSEFALLT
jgi:hypothetical protein